MDDSLFSLIHTGSFRQLQLILECGCDVNCRNSRQETPLMVAMISINGLERRQAVVGLLIHFRADVNCRNLRGQTPLMYSCIINQLDTLDILMKCKFLDYNMKDFEGNTALMYACALGNREPAKILLDAHNSGRIQLDFDIVNNEGATALLFARDCFLDDIVQMLSSSMSDKKAECFMCEQEKDGEHTNEREIGRIKELAETVKYIPELKDKEDDIGMAFEEVEVEEEDSKLQESTSEVISGKTDPVYSPSEITKHTQNETTSVPDTHVFQNSDACVEKLLDIAEKSRDEVKHILDKEFYSTGTAFLTEQTQPDKEKTKCKIKRKRQRYQNNDLPIYGRPVTSRDELRDEFAVGKQIYPSEIHSMHGRDNDDLTLIRHKIKSNAKQKLYKAIKVTSDGHYLELETGKLDYLNLDSNVRAQLLGRTVWSVYGAPLPPIPIDEESLQRVIDKIAALRKYLGKAKFQEGRLVDLDPELWCIIESMRTDIQPV